MGLFGKLLTGTDPDPFGVFGKKGKFDPLDKNNEIPYLQRPEKYKAPELSAQDQMILAALQGTWSNGVNRGAPAVAPPIPQPGNLASIYAQAGPFMQQALGLAGQSRPVSGPPPQPGMPWSPPSPAHIAPRQPGQFQISPIELMNRQWLSALNGR